MTDDEVFDMEGNMTRLGLAVRVIAESCDIDQMISTFDRAHALGPFIDPTSYRDALQKGDMEAMENLTRALAPVVKIWNEQIAPKAPA